MPVSQLTVMALRHMARRPLRAGATSLGIAMGVGLLVTALLSFDSVEHMIDVAFFRTDRQHATLTFTDEKHARALQAVERMPGVMRAEPYRSVAVRLRNGHLSRQLSIIGKPKDMDLSRVLDLDDRPVRLPPSGLVINERVAQILNLRRGDVRRSGDPRGPARRAQRPGGRRHQELFRSHRLHGSRCARPADVLARN